MAQSAIPVLLECSGKGTGPGNPECQWPEFVRLFQEVIQFGIYLASVVVVIVLIKTGFKMMTSGSPDEISEAKKSLTKVLWGYFFMLCGWLLVKYILTQLGVSEDYQLLTK